MRIAFATDDRNGLDGVLAYHFGRCAFFTFVDVEGGEVVKVEVKENPYADNHQAGVVPGWIREQGAEMIVAGGMGPRAQQMFASLGIEPVVGAYGKVGDVLNQMLKETLKLAEVEHKEHGSGGEECDDAGVERLRKEVEHLRKVVADLVERVNKLEERL